MKKNFAIAFGTALALSLSLAACGGSQTATESDHTAIETTSGEEASADGKVQLPNPFVEYDTVEEAEEAAGFDITVPDAIDGYPEKIIRALVTDDSKLIEVIYQNDKGDEIRIRKAPGTEDISGDYNEYGQSSQLTVGDAEVTMKGNNDTVSLAVWTNNDFTYSVAVSAGMSDEALSDLILSIQ